MIDLSTKYLGLTLKNPLVVSANPLCRELDNLKRMEDSQASAIVLHSLFEEQIEIESNDLDNFLWQTGDVSAEAQSYYPNFAGYNIGPDAYLDHIRRAKQSLSIPVIASLNGVTTGGWTRYAKLMEQAGADAIELNVYFLPVNPYQSTSDVEEEYYDLVREVRKSVSIPLAVKVGPYFTSFANTAVKLEQAGANALVIFNRFYQPDLDLEALEVVPHLALSRSAELNLRIHWTAVLYEYLKGDIAITGGVHTAEDVVKSMMAGARVTMLASALLEQGIPYLHVLSNHLKDWLDKHEYVSIEQMQGSMARKNVANSAAYDRANYVKTLSSYSTATTVR